jgi:hypothetical protein
MRWFVEVSRVGEQAPPDKYCLEAKQWQAALQEVRKKRGDTGPLSKFSIELLDDGYRAVDASQKLRYMVAKAPASAALIEPQAAAAPPKTSPIASPAPLREDPLATDPQAAPPESAEPSTKRMPSEAPPPDLKPSQSAIRVPDDAVPPAPKTAQPAAPPVAQTAAAKAAAPAATKAVEPAAPSAVAPAGPKATSIAPAKVMAPPRADSGPPSEGPEIDVTLVESMPPEGFEPPSAGPSASTAPPTEKDSPSKVLPASAAPAKASPPATGAVGSFPLAQTAAGKAEAKSVQQGATAKPADATTKPEPQRPSSHPTQRSLEAARPPDFQVIRQREEEPTTDSPIVYREYAYAVAAKTDAAQAELLIWVRFKEIQSKLADRSERKFVQLAVFDHVFEKRPERPPIASLAWRDWRGDAVVMVHGKKVVPAGVKEQADAKGVASPPRPESEAPKAANADAAAKPKSAPSEPPPSSRRIAPGKRRASEDLIGELFETMHELHFLPDMVSGVEFVLSTVETMLPSEGAIVHVFDINARQFVIVRAYGKAAESLLLHRTPDVDPFFNSAMRQTRAVSAASDDEKFLGERWTKLGVEPHDALFGPAQIHGRYLGAVEIANPHGGGKYSESEANALEYICAQFAEFLAARPIVLDADVVLPKT